MFLIIVVVNFTFSLYKLCKENVLLNTLLHFLHSIIMLWRKKKTREELLTIDHWFSIFTSAIRQDYYVPKKQFTFSVFFSAQHSPVQMFCSVWSHAHRGHKHLRVDPDRVQGRNQGHCRIQSGQGRGRLRGLHDQRWE